MTEGHYDLYSLMDYEDGITLEEFSIFYKETLKFQVERGRQMAQCMAVALGSLFDKKIFKEFNDNINKIIRTLEPAEDKRRKTDRRESMIHTMKELNKLRVLF